MFLFDLRGEIDECVSDYVTTEQKICLSRPYQFYTVSVMYSTGIIGGNFSERNTMTTIILTRNAIIDDTKLLNTNKK